jgi:hypothetical protein
MRTDGAARRKVAPRRCQARPALAGQQRTEQQDRPAQAADQRAVRLVLDDVRAAHPKRAAADALHFGADVEQQPRHHFHIADARDVVQDALVGCQQAGGEQGQGSVLVALDLHFSR